MLFLFRKKEIVIDTFTSYKEVYDFFPIEESVKFMPTWWKKIPKNQEMQNDFVDSIPAMTMRHCSGIIDYYRNGFILPLWSDVKIKTTEESFSYQFASNSGEIESHGDYQHNNSFPEYQHLKFLCPWYLSSKTRENFLCTMPSWNLKDYWQKLFILPGILEFNMNSAIHVNLFVKRESNSILLEAGTPMYYLSPLTDKKIKFVKHLVSAEEIRRNIYGNPFFTNKRARMVSFLKKVEVKS